MGKKQIQKVDKYKEQIIQQKTYKERRYIPKKDYIGKELYKEIIKWGKTIQGDDYIGKKQYRRQSNIGKRLEIIYKNKKVIYKDGK